MVREKTIEEREKVVLFTKLVQIQTISYKTDTLYNQIEITRFYRYTTEISKKKKK